MLSRSRDQSCTRAAAHNRQCDVCASKRRAAQDCACGCGSLRGDDRDKSEITDACWVTLVPRCLKQFSIDPNQIISSLYITSAIVMMRGFEFPLNTMTMKNMYLKLYCSPAGPIFYRNTFKLCICYSNLDIVVLDHLKNVGLLVLFTCCIAVDGWEFTKTNHGFTSNITQKPWLP